MNDTTPWIDPELVAAGQLLQSRGLVAPDRTQAPLSEVRAATDRIGAFLGAGSVPLERERDLSLPGPHGQVPCRLYLPDNAEKPPLIVYAHGGGFMQGSLPSWDAMLRELVRQSGVATLSGDYRLSPEYRFPVAFDEMVAMVRLARREGAGFGIDPARLAVGGDSAGANLALAAALALRDAGERTLGFMLLIYGCFSTDTESPSWQRFGQGAGLSQTQMRWIWRPISNGRSSGTIGAPRRCSPTSPVCLRHISSSAASTPCSMTATVSPRASRKQVCPVS